MHNVPHSQPATLWYIVFLPLQDIIVSNVLCLKCRWRGSVQLSRQGKILRSPQPVDYRCVFRVRQKGGEREREKKKMVDGAARQSGQRGLPILLALEQSKAKRERERELQSPHEQRGGHMARGRQTPLMPRGRRERERGNPNLKQRGFPRPEPSRKHRPHITDETLPLQSGHVGPVTLPG